MQPACIIVGGGAAGLAAAACFSRCGIPFLLAERLDRVGKKILSTGSGRCNCSNLDMNAAHYGNAEDFVRQAYQETPPENVRSFLSDLGLMLAEEDGRLYPRTMSAATVLDVLRAPLSASVGEVLTDCDIVSVTSRDASGNFTVTAKDGRSFSAPNLLICAGGSAAPKLGTNGSGVRLVQTLGHKAVPPVPALVQLCCRPVFPALKGLHVHASLSLRIDGTVEAKEEGELLFTDYGVSGVCTLQLSGMAARTLQQRKSVRLAIDLLPEVTDKNWLADRLSVYGSLPLSDVFSGVFSRMLTQTILKSAGLPLSAPADSLTDAALQCLEDAIHAFPMEVTGTRGFENAQVTAGGIRTDEVCPQTMESRLCPGLFLAGEVLDVDGPCGGYNLHFAFASAINAARTVILRAQGDPA